MKQGRRAAPTCCASAPPACGLRRSPTPIGGARCRGAQRMPRHRHPPRGARTRQWTAGGCAETQGAGRPGASPARTRRRRRRSWSVWAQSSARRPTAAHTPGAARQREKAREQARGDGPRDARRAHSEHSGPHRAAALASHRSRDVTRRWCSRCSRLARPRAQRALKGAQDRTFVGVGFSSGAALRGIAPGPASRCHPAAERMPIRSLSTSWDEAVRGEAERRANWLGGQWCCATALGSSSPRATPGCGR